MKADVVQPMGQAKSIQGVPHADIVYLETMVSIPRGVDGYSAQSDSIVEDAGDNGGAKSYLDEM